MKIAMKEKIVKRTMYHTHINIQGFLDTYKNKSIAGIFRSEDGELSNLKARKYLNECLQKGWRVIPCKECDNFDYQTGCKGHPIKEVKL